MLPRLGNAAILCFFHLHPFTLSPLSYLCWLTKSSSWSVYSTEVKVLLSFLRFCFFLGFSLFPTFFHPRIFFSFSVFLSPLSLSQKTRVALTSSQQRLSLPKRHFNGKETENKLLLSPSQTIERYQTYFLSHKALWATTLKVQDRF